MNATISKSSLTRAWSLVRSAGYPWRRSPLRPERSRFGRRAGAAENRVRTHHLPKGGGIATTQGHA